jgi:hypothetical protein
MNTLYAVAVLEGYLSQHHPLPPMIHEALSLLKEEHQQKIAPEGTSVATTKRKKLKLTKEQREKQLHQLARMREAMKQKREAQNSAKRAA